MLKIHWINISLTAFLSCLKHDCSDNGMPDSYQVALPGGRKINLDTETWSDSKSQSPSRSDVVTSRATICNHVLSRQAI